MDLAFLQEQLKKRWFLPVSWNFKFEINLENKISFLYECQNFEEMLKKCEGLPQPLVHYAVNRWYNFWSNKGLHNIFSEHNIVTPNLNQYNDIDSVMLNNVDFKVKSHVYPYHFARTLRYALLHKEEFLYWLYRKANRFNRREPQNKLFIVFYQRDGEHWRLKAELCWIQTLIDEYLDKFDIHRTTRLHLLENQTNYSDIIWCIKPE